MVLQGRAGEEPKRRGPEGKINDEQCKALSVAFVSFIALTQSSKEPVLSSVKLKEMLSQLLPEDII